MRTLISEMAKWGDLTVGPRIVDQSVRKKMERALQEIKSGRFAEGWLKENRRGRKRYSRLLADAQSHEIEKVGARLRGLMAWKAKANSSPPKPSRPRRT
jgi:ketol-acid reductoisomerase